MNYKIIALLLIICSCQTNQKTKRYKTPETKKVLKSNSAIVQNDTLTPQQLMLLYAKAKSSDTVIPYEVYKISKSKTLLDKIWLYEAIESYDIEKIKYQTIFKEMFSFEKNLESVFIQIENHIKKARELNREIVKQQYYDYNSVESPSFAYLCKVKDSFAIEITEKMFINDQAVNDELKLISQWILEDFNDSSYVKKLEK